MRVSTVTIPAGHVVQALTGRDSGGWFLTVLAQQGTSLYLADGETRHMSRPKRKNVRHVRDLGQPADADTVLRMIGEMRDEGQREAAIRSCIHRYRRLLEETGKSQRDAVSKKEEA